ncbi:Pkinase-domain-containing protein [Aulographum hederae CBS 113979]|uniref:non-specific serine/threonine protein kinase n=1 Tax=Aulographum hederae CBS 113979 TaxID=1176131 RepID=A0A6G1GRD7_9PEZI|nr:Pkinase-domain-containing protein [Aulographum hederae CBS 113979]
MTRSPPSDAQNHPATTMKPSEPVPATNRNFLTPNATPATNPAASPVLSVSGSSLHSTDGFSLPAALNGAPPTANGDANGHATAGGDPRKLSTATLSAPKKPTMTSRLSGMFKRDGTDSRDSSKSNLAERMADTTIQEGRATPAQAKPPPTPATQGRVARSDSTGRSPPRSSEERSSRKPDEHVSKRFVMAEDGTHEHRLVIARRQQKLKDLFLNISGWGRVANKEGGEETPLSLMSDWVSQKKREQDRAPLDAKGGPNQSQTLVQKYGKCQEVVGHGAFGIVRIAHKTDSKDPKREQLFAVKEFRQRPGESAKKYQKRLTSEFCISSSMQHPNVIHTLDLMKDDKGDYCEVMEYCAGGDLYTLILTSGTLEVAEADCYFKQLCRGVEYMHEMGVAHRDLKPENLLLTQRGAIKITDFGNGECFRMAWEKEAHMTAGLCGSAPYIAPEEYVDQEFDPRAVDVWACGIIYMAMRTGRHLWRVAQKGEDEFFTRYLEDRKTEGGFRPIEVLRRAKCRNVIYSILDPNPSRRLTAHQTLFSEWVKEIKVCHAGSEGF